jgi:hypothetical protein
MGVRKVQCDQMVWTKSAQYLSKNTQFGAQSKNTKKGEKLYWFEQIWGLIQIIFRKNLIILQFFWNFILNELQFWQIYMNLLMKIIKKWQ